MCPLSAESVVDFESGRARQRRRLASFATITPVELKVPWPVLAACACEDQPGGQTLSGNTGCPPGLCGIDVRNYPAASPRDFPAVACLYPFPPARTPLRRPRVSRPDSGAGGNLGRRALSAGRRSSRSRCIIALLLLNATLLIVNTAGTMDSNEQYARSYEIKRSLTAFQSTIATAESGQRGYLLTGQRAYLEPFLRATRSWRAEIERLRTLVANDGGRGMETVSAFAASTNSRSMTGNAVERLERPLPARRTWLGLAADVAGTDWATAGMDRVRSLIERMMRRRTPASRRCVVKYCTTCGSPSASPYSQPS